MLASAIPLRFQIPWAKNAGGSFIRTVPVASQIGVNAGFASYNDGFVPDNFTQIAAGGVPPFGQDMNGVLNETTTWDQWYQAGAPIPFDATFASAIGGYPKGAKLASAILAGADWYSTADNNATNPDDPSTSANWARVGLPTGTPLQQLTATMPPGFVAMNALSIGNAASNAGYASADAVFLFVFNWLSFPNSQCVLLNSAGVPIARGATPWADFAANNQLTLPNGKGITFVGADTMGGSASTFLSGAPIISGNATTPGSVIGETLHQLITAELAAHTHASTLSDPTHSHLVSGAFQNTPVGGGSNAQPLISTGTLGDSTNAVTTGITLNNVSAGSGTAHNTVQRSMIVYWGQKL